MNSLKLTFLSVSVAILLAPSTASTQGLSKKEIQTSVSTIAKLISDHYVFPEKGNRIAKHLLAESDRRKFDEAKDWETLASILTTSLREFSNDGHLYVRNDQKVVRELEAAKTEMVDADSNKPFSYDPFYYGPDAAKNNFGFQEVKILKGNVGYIKLNEINISSKSLAVLFAAMKFVSNTRALIIDLTDNGGGGSEVGPVFESFFLPKDVPVLEFKKREGESRIDKTVLWLTEDKYDKPLYIIVNKGTASAAEAFAFSLQQNKRAQIVGQRSAGAANMNSWYIVNDNMYVSVSTAAPVLPGSENSWEQKGVQPDHVTKDGDEIDFILQSIK
jgi:hypothetical protein